MAVGIRREDKNEWERRVPLTPTAVGQLVAEGIDVIVQPSTLRVFSDEDYHAAGARVQEDLGACSVVLAVKEIPAERAEELIGQAEERRSEFVRVQFGVRQDDPGLYDLVINTATLGFDNSAKLILEAVRSRFS